MIFPSGVRRLVSLSFSSSNPAENQENFDVIFFAIKIKLLYIFIYNIIIINNILFLVKLPRRWMPWPYSIPRNITIRAVSMLILESLISIWSIWCKVWGMNLSSVWKVKLHRFFYYISTQVSSIEIEVTQMKEDTYSQVNGCL